MKKLALGVILSALCAVAKADTVPLGTQLQASLLQHVSAVAETTTGGYTKLNFLDGVIQIGHYKGDYIVGVDAGFSNNIDNPGALAMTYGVHLHVISWVNNFFQINPALGQMLNQLEITPRYSYDQDVHHGVLGWSFGAQIPFQ